MRRRARSSSRGQTDRSFFRSASTDGDAMPQHHSGDPGRVRSFIDLRLLTCRPVMRPRLLAATLLAAAVPVAYGVYVLAGLPPRAQVRALASQEPGPTSLMRQREAEAKARGRRPRAVQEWIPLQQVSRSLIQAVIASEDQKFFGHEGVDWEAIQASVEANVKRGRAARGGSTITQQLAKNLFFDTRRSLTRKLRELIVTWWLELDLSKVRILALYLNAIEWGDGIYGCEAA